MQTDYIREIFQIVGDKKLGFVNRGHPFIENFLNSTEKLRDCLVKLEKRDYPNGNLPQISVISPLKLSLKSQIDFLVIEIPQICNQCCISLASAYYFLTNTSDTTHGYDYKNSDLFFWINIDSGFRFASSGWDRLSLLLNIAFNLKISKYNLPSVLQALPNQLKNITNDDDFKSLKKFRDNRFSDLEFKLAGGARHETTHVISRSTRFFYEYQEQFELGSDKFEKRREDELSLLEEHLKLLIEGINHTLTLINNHFNDSVYDDKKLNSSGNIIKKLDN